MAQAQQHFKAVTDNLMGWGLMQRTNDPHPTGIPLGLPTFWLRKTGIVTWLLHRNRGLGRPGLRCNDFSVNNLEQVQPGRQVGNLGDRENYSAREGRNQNRYACPRARSYLYLPGNIPTHDTLLHQGVHIAYLLLS
jgi:hypothetical protein